MYSDQQLLAFVIDKKFDLLYLHVDKAGLDYLLSQLEHIRRKLDQNQVEHFHLFSEDWGDGTLSISDMGNSKGEGRPIHQLNVMGWTDEWVEKHGFKRS